jgi:hypothetical protein
MEMRVSAFRCHTLLNRRISVRACLLTQQRDMQRSSTKSVIDRQGYAWLLKIQG